MNELITLRLSVEQAGYLSALITADPVFADLVRSRPSICLKQDGIILDSSDAKALDDYLGDRLARTGFDENYDPNRDGVMLESLIDAVFPVAAH